MPQTNNKFNKAKKEKNDEFYTKLSDVENELKNYGPEIEKLSTKLGRKVRVGCNCDDPNGSAFHKFFNGQYYFHKEYEAKFTHYQLVPNDLTGYTKIQLEKPGTKKNSEGVIETLDYMYVDADGYAKGDFRAKEQIPLGEGADIIITNPPFSLFREFMAMIMKYEKKFLIMGAKSSIIYKETAKLILQNKVWLGVNLPPNFIRVDGEIVGTPTYGYTNLQTPFENRRLYLGKSYYKNKEDYPTADNMDVIFVKKTKEIPYDYEGAMAVPISFLQKYNPEQFEILGNSSYYKYGFDKAFNLKVGGKQTYTRLIIKNKMVMTDEDDE